MSEKEYIERDSIYRKVKERTNPYGKPTLDYKSGVKVLNMIEREPAADVVEIVRCKDCIKRNTANCAMWFNCMKCGGQWSWESDNGFCNFGERKEQKNHFGLTDPSSTDFCINGERKEQT